MTEQEVDVPALLRALGIDTARRGDELQACCPLPDHEDRHPSWSIVDAPGTERHGRWKCWSCGRGGGPVGLVRRVLGWEAVAGSAVRAWIAAHCAGQPRALPGWVAQPVLPAVRPPFTLPPGVVVEALERWPGPVRQYAQARGLTAQQVGRWGLGYALEGRLEGRLVVPVRDATGRAVGYQARTFTGSPIRYLTPHVGENADGAALWGAQHWPRTGAGRDLLYVAEGALNGLALERAGAQHLVALSGGGSFTAANDRRELAPHVAAQLGTWRAVVLFCDADAPGREMAGAVRAALGRHVVVLDLVLPGGLDACDLWREEPQALADWVGAAGDWAAA